MRSQPSGDADTRGFRLQAKEATAAHFSPSHVLPPNRLRQGYGESRRSASRGGGRRKRVDKFTGLHPEGTAGSERHRQRHTRRARRDRVGMDIVDAAGRLAREARRIEVVDVAVPRVEQVEDVDDQREAL